MAIVYRGWRDDQQRDRSSVERARGHAVSETELLTLGAVVTCSDGECGELQSCVIEPQAYAITHLVVGEKLRKSRARIVPVDLVDAASAKGVELRCTKAQFDALGEAEETGVRTGSSFDQESQWTQEHTMARVFGPHVDLGMGFGSGRDGVAETHMPVGGGVIRRGQHVHASDGPIGQVRGLVADPRQHQVTDILLDEGHLWDKKEVVVPIDAVKFVIDDGVHLKLTRREVGALPPADLSRLA
jgi:sporulation protein YlmC with PRC-barrel domain